MLATYSLDRKIQFINSNFLGKCHGRFESPDAECNMLAILYVRHNLLRKTVCFSSQNNLTDIIVFVNSIITFPSQKSCDLLSGNINI